MENNYCAFIAKIDKTVEIQGADKIQLGYVLGDPVVISKDMKEGDVGVLFPAETALSQPYLHNNNLYRNSEKNINPDASGFFEENGRVRAQPFLKVKSTAYFAPLDSLSFTGYDVSKLSVGDRFEELNKIDIAKKYINPRTLKARGNNATKARKVDETPFFKQHKDTNQFAYNMHQIEKGDIVSIQAKRHGTSMRCANTLVKIDLPKWKRMINKVIPVFPTEKWDYVVGTRRVVLKNIDKDKDGYHGSENFRFQILDDLKPHLSKGVTVYGEILGYVNGSPIMPPHDVTKLKDKQFTKKYGKSVGYSYGCLPEEYKYFIYRVTMTTPSGEEIDLTQPQLKKWCEERGISGTFDVVDPFVFDGDYDKLKELVTLLTEREDLLTEDYTSPTQISEGVIIRADKGNLTPVFLKSKSTAFKIMEGIAHELQSNMEDES